VAEAGGRGPLNGVCGGRWSHALTSTACLPTLEAQCSARAGSCLTCASANGTLFADVGTVVQVEECGWWVQVEQWARLCLSASVIDDRCRPFGLFCRCEASSACLPSSTGGNYCAALSTDTCMESCSAAHQLFSRSGKSEDGASRGRMQVEVTLDR
jgi:hypothetical protein